MQSRAILICAIVATPAYCQVNQNTDASTSILLLQCDGTADVTEAHNSDLSMHSTTHIHGTVSDPQGAATVTGQAYTDGSGAITSYSKREVNVRFVFEISDSGARVRFPSTLIPVFHGGNDNAGWWMVRDFAKDGPAYTGKIALNFMNKPRFSIDRRSGDFDLRGGINMNARGNCRKIDADSALRF